VYAVQTQNTACEVYHIVKAVVSIEIVYGRKDCVMAQQSLIKNGGVCAVGSPKS
jgi:hypothetical protein